MEGPVEWIPSIGTIIAAGLIALNMGRRLTGWGFVLFTVVSMMWIYSGLVEDALPIAAMNSVLLIINAWGVWRYLIRKEQP